MRVLKTVPNLKKVRDENPSLLHLIFDMDGTLFNTEPLHAVVHKKITDIFTNGHFSNLDAKHYEDTYKGLADKLVFEELREDFLLSCPLDEFINLKKKIILEEIENIELNSVFNFKILSLIEEAEKKGIRASLVTASDRSTTMSLLEKFKFTELFQIIRTDEDSKLSKPDPAPYNEAIEILKFMKNEVVIFEDSKAGVAAALASNAPMYKVEWYK